MSQAAGTIGAPGCQLSVIRGQGADTWQLIVGHGPSERRHLAGNDMPPGWRRSGFARPTSVTYCFLSNDHSVAPHLSPGHTLVSLDLSAIGAGQAGAYPVESMGLDSIDRSDAPIKAGNRINRVWPHWLRNGSRRRYAGRWDGWIEGEGTPAPVGAGV